MREPLTWSIPAGRYFHISVRIHLLFVFLAIVMIWRGATYGYAVDALIIQAILFFSVLFHEFGHCFAARWMEGDATDILMWPLGGLASIDIPQTARANFVTTAGGPLVNLVLCALTAGPLLGLGLVPPVLDPFWDLVRIGGGSGPLHNWSLGTDVELTALPMVLARIFYLNWILFLFNVLFLGFPLDGGRLLQASLWPHLGFRRATMWAIYSGWIIALGLAIYTTATMTESGAFTKMLLFMLALFVYDAGRKQYQLLESGGLGDDGAFGYDFSQGYTSLERDQPAQRRPKQSFWRRWLDRRATRKRLKHEEERVAEERRVDELLAKIRDQGTQALSDEEKRFLNRVSAKLRNRNQS